MKDKNEDNKVNFTYVQGVQEISGEIIQLELPVEIIYIGKDNRSEEKKKNQDVKNV